MEFDFVVARMTVVPRLRATRLPLSSMCATPVLLLLQVTGTGAAILLPPWS